MKKGRENINLCLFISDSHLSKYQSYKILWVGKGREGRVVSTTHIVYNIYINKYYYIIYTDSRNYPTFPTLPYPFQISNRVVFIKTLLL